MTTLYKVTRTFTGGTLKGITVTERTTASYQTGQTVDKPIGGSPYRVDSVEPVPAQNLARSTRTGRLIDITETKEVEGGILGWTWGRKRYTAVRVFIPTKA